MMSKVFHTCPSPCQDFSWMILMPQSVAVMKNFLKNNKKKLIIWDIFYAHSSQTKPDRGCVLSSLPSCPLS